MSTHEKFARQPRERVHTGRHDVDARAGVGLACCVRAIMPLAVARLDFLSLWTDETLLPSYSRVAACLNEGWIGGRRRHVVVVR
jgi:hypothetical protein